MQMHQYVAINYFLDFPLTERPVILSFSVAEAYIMLKSSLYPSYNQVRWQFYDTEFIWLISSLLKEIIKVGNISTQIMKKLSNAKERRLLEKTNRKAKIADHPVNSEHVDT